MRNEAHIQATFVSLQPPSHILPTETISDTSKLLDTKLVPRILNRTVDYSLNRRLRMPSAPFGQVETSFLLFDTDRVSCKEVRDQNQISVAGYRVCKPKYGQ